MKQIIAASLITPILLASPLHAATVSCAGKSGYELYECRVASICEQYKPEKMIFNTDGKDEHRYLELDDSDPEFFSLNQKKYRENMNQIYKCSLIQVQRNALEFVKQQKKDPDVASLADVKINQQIQLLDQRQKFCANIDDSTIYNKQAVLQQATYEICKYSNYLAYLEEYASDLGNVILDDSSILKVSETQLDITRALEDEQNHILKVFPLAYNAYIQYENNIALHLMLQLIKQDFIIFRERLQKVLGPISQLIYKAHNSMTVR